MDIQNEVIKLLNYYGITDIKTESIEYIISETTQDLLNLTNQNTLPNGLNYVLIKRVVGKYLEQNLAIGKLNIDGLDLDNVITSITRGDVSMSLKGKSPKEQLEISINELKEYGKDQIYRYRRIVW